MHKIVNKISNKKVENKMEYDIIIIGGGPAGITSAIYALRADKKVLIIEKEAIGGKISSAPLVENYPGIKEINGFELSQKLREQIISLNGEIQTGEVVKIINEEKEKIVITRNKEYKCNSIIISTGTKYKKLELENEEKFIGKGISFCATCDGFFYKNKIVAVIGGGNSAVANAIELSNICEKVYLIQILEHLTAEPMLIDKLNEKKNVEIIYQAVVNKILGEEKLTGIEINEKSKQKIVEIDGMFLSIGQIPETDIFKNMLKTDKYGYLDTNENCMTNIEGIFVAGDCAKKKIRQLTTAVSDGTIAALNAIEYIDNK